jgi:GNAT superfamily N-acetyltransferase/predicted double-glycine peptidase
MDLATKTAVRQKAAESAEKGADILSKAEVRQSGVISVRNNSSHLVEEIYASVFDFSRDWSRDAKDIVRLEKESFPEKVQSSSDEINEMLADKSAIVVVARNEKGRIIGMIYAIGWPYVENENEVPKANGGEKEAFEEMPSLVNQAIGREVPKEKMLYVHSIAVHSDYKRHGVGTYIANAALSIAREKGFEIFVGHAMVETKSAKMFENGLGARRIRDDDYKNWYATKYSTRPFVVDLSKRDELQALRRTSFPVMAQTNGYNCGPTALKLMLDHQGLNVGLEQIEKLANTTKKDGTFPEDIAATVEKLGLKAEVKHNATIEDLIRKSDEGSPAIVLCTLHYLPTPDFVELPEKLWYAWQDNVRHLTSQSRTLEKVFKPFEDVHYLIVAGHGEKNLKFVDVSQGKEKMIPKGEFEQRWFGTMNKDGQKIRYDHWMMTIGS